MISRSWHIVRKKENEQEKKYMTCQYVECSREK